MMVVGLMYSLVSPSTMLIVFIALVGMLFVSRYNILFVYSQPPMADMSSDFDLYKIVIRIIFIGFCLMIFALLSYVIASFTTYKMTMILILLVNFIYLLI